MPVFMFRGRITLDGVTFMINAEDSQEAIEKARRGEFDDHEELGAEMVDWDIRPGTCERDD